MRYAVIENNIVTNTIEAEGELPGFVMVRSDIAAIGDTFDGTDFHKPAPQPPGVPESVSPRQIRQALTRGGLRANVEAAIAAADQDTKDWYEFATEFQRSNEHVIAMGTALGVSSDDLDNLWRLAASL